jgi:hypothetical protein
LANIVALLGINLFRQLPNRPEVRCLISTSQSTISSAKSSDYCFSMSRLRCTCCRARWRRSSRSGQA